MYLNNQLSRKFIFCIFSFYFGKSAVFYITSFGHKLPCRYHNVISKTKWIQFQSIFQLSQWHVLMFHFLDMSTQVSVEKMNELIELFSVIYILLRSFESIHAKMPSFVSKIYINISALTSVCPFARVYMYEVLS